MKRLAVLSFSLGLVLVCAVNAETEGGSACSGFPWTVTATPYGADSVAVRVCGTFAGCRPHDPQFSVSGSEIGITLTQAELPDCMCLGVVDTFEQAIIVHPVASGAYTVRVTAVSCGQPLAAGSTDFMFGAASAIPTLNSAAAVAFALLLPAAAVFRLRS